MTYEEVKPSEWNFSQEGDFIEGVLLKKQEDIGVNKSKLYTLETAEGIKNVWGSAVLDQRMGLMNIGNKIKIVYEGLGEAQPGKNAPKLFTVFVDRD